MKRRVVETLRKRGLLAFADRINYYVHRCASMADNQHFRRSRPEFALPPPGLTFETCGHVSWRTFEENGRQHAAALSAAIAADPPAGRLRVLEWGCGVGRIMRHLPALLPADTELTGVDVDRRATQWCATHLKGMVFVPSPQRPPLAFAAQAFNVVYQYSVFTHLSPALVEAWVAELARVLAADGVLFASTHGNHYLDMLNPAERARYDAGYAVSKENYAEGRKFFLSFHPPAYMRALFSRHFATVEHLPPDLARAMPQDRWIARDPRPNEACH